MSRQTERHDTAAELRAQLDELLAAFDDIARFGRERRLSQASAGTHQAAANSYLDEGAGL